MKKLIYLTSILSIAVSSLSINAQWYDWEGFATVVDHAPFFRQDDICYRYVGNNRSQFLVVDLGGEFGQEGPFYDKTGHIEIPSTVNDGTHTYPVVGLDVNSFNMTTYSSVRLPESLEYMASGCFHASSVSDIIFGPKLKTMGLSCFSYCDQLISVSLPDALYSIGDYCFCNCPLVSIEFGAALTYLGNKCFRNNYDLKEVILPDGLRGMGVGCFDGCSSLEKVTIPQYVDIYGCFNDCPAIKQIIIKHKCPPSLSHVSGTFNKVDKKNCLLIVPNGTAEKYRSRDAWKDFKIIEEGQVNLEPVSQEPTDETSDVFNLDGTKLVRRSDSPSKTCLIKSGTGNTRIRIR